MANTPRVSYKRAPSDELLKLLMPGGDLSWLVDLGKKEVADYHHDVHFRSRDEVHVYRGLTMILSIKRMQSDGIKVPGKIDEAYKKQLETLGLCRTWEAKNPRLCALVRHYLSRVKVDKKWIHGEGFVQSQWSRATEPWVSFDREVALDYEFTEEREEIKQFLDVEYAFSALQTKARENGWTKPPKLKIRNKLDRLSVDHAGHLVILELKDASAKPDEVYYAPFQLLQYVWEWTRSLKRDPSLWANLRKLINARRKLCLISQATPDLTGNIRAAIGFGSIVPRSENRRERGYKYKKVLEIANEHLPSDVLPIETWAWSDNGPYPLSW